MFFNLEENVLDELIDYAARSERVDVDKRAEYIEEIKWWKKRLDVEAREDGEGKGDTSK